MATGSESAGNKYAKFNAKMKVAIAERNAAGYGKTKAQSRRPKLAKAGA